MADFTVWGDDLFTIREEHGARISALTPLNAALIYAGGQHATASGVEPDIVWVKDSFGRTLRYNITITRTITAEVQTLTASSEER